MVAFESNDVLLADSMMHQAIGVGFVSKAHVFPCEELVYRPLDPPVRQTLHLRYLLAQPALSRHLHSVEAMVGMPLFSRDHNRLKPTGAGTIFVNNARNILRIETEMFKNLAGGKR